jgi:hypothetical protein
MVTRPTPGMAWTETPSGTGPSSSIVLDVDPATVVDVVESSSMVLLDEPTVVDVDESIVEDDVDDPATVLDVDEALDALIVELTPA